MADALTHRREDGPLPISRNTFANWCGLRSSGKVGQWEREHGWPTVGKRLDLVGVVAWMWREIADMREERARLRRQVKAATPSSDDEEELLTGKDTPALERYRAARAAQELLKLETMKGNLVDLSDLESDLVLINKRLRQVSDQLQRQFGREAGEMLVEALDDIFVELRGRLVSREQQPEPEALTDGG